MKFGTNNLVYVATGRPGEERTYAMTVQPNETWAAIQKRDGFHLISFEVDIPDPTAEVKLGTVKPSLTGIVHAGDVVTAKLE